MNDSLLKLRQEKEQLILQLESELEYYYKLSQPKSNINAGEKGRVEALEVKFEANIKEIAILTENSRLAELKHREDKVTITKYDGVRAGLEKNLAKNLDKVQKLTQDLAQSGREVTDQQAHIVTELEIRTGLEKDLAKRAAKLQKLTQDLAQSGREVTDQQAHIVTELEIRTGLEKDLAKRAAKLQKLMQDLSQSKREIANQKDRLTAFRVQEINLEAKINDLSGQKAHLKIELAERTSQYIRKKTNAALLINHIEADPLLKVVRAVRKAKIGGYS